jgi:hypothetical protein
MTYSFAQAKAPASARYTAPALIDPLPKLSPFYTSEHEVLDGDTTLVIVDMQTRFLNECKAGAQPSPVAAVVRQIKLAMAMHWSIVVLEMQGRWGKRIAQIVELLEGNNGTYPKYARALKNTASGASEVLGVCHERAFGLGLFRLTGVYLDGCVMATARGLLDQDPVAELRLIEEACSAGHDVTSAWATVRRKLHPNRRVAFSSDSIDFGDTDLV